MLRWGLWPLSGWHDLASAHAGAACLPRWVSNPGASVGDGCCMNWPSSLWDIVGIFPIYIYIIYNIIYIYITHTHIYTIPSLCEHDETLQKSEDRYQKICPSLLKLEGGCARHLRFTDFSVGKLRPGILPFSSHLWDTVLCNSYSNYIITHTSTI